MKQFRICRISLKAYFKKRYLERIEASRNRRSEMNRFNCVPSAINYVINTRFTVQQGYLVEKQTCVVRVYRNN